MATSKTKASEKSVNFTTTQKTKKPMLSEQEFKRSFQPLTSRVDGKAQLTYAGYQHSVNNNGGAFLKIIFSVLDVTGKNPQNLSVLASYKYSETNVLGRLLKTMGYEHQVNQVVIDEDDEFGHTIDENLDTIYDFLDEQKGLIFKAFCLMPEGNNFYRIDVDSIVPLLDKLGNHKRAYDASEGVSNDKLTIDIDASGGDD